MDNNININYRVLMYDGTTKSIADIVVGDQVMGPDSNPRNVLETHVEFEEMSNVVFSKNKKVVAYTFNQNHKLFLKNFYKDCFETLLIKNCNKNGVKWKNRHRMIKAHVVDFNNKNYNFFIPPYILGLLLGDGSLKQYKVTFVSMDYEIIKEFENFVRSLNYKPVTYSIKNTRAYRMLYIKDIDKNFYRSKDGSFVDPDKIRSEIRNLSLLDTGSHNKFVPPIYKYSTYQNRLEILAGLLDTDGHLGPSKHVFDYVSKSRQLSEDVMFLATSCGLVSSIKEIFKKGVSYHRVYIGGDTHIIPTRIKRKQAIKISNIKQDRLLYPTITLAPIGKHQFYEIVVDKDNLYLGEDFSIICGAQ